MMLLVLIVAGLHLAVYLGIIWYGWQSYKLLRKRSWRYMGIGFTVLLLYRAGRFLELLLNDTQVDAERVLLPFIGAVFLLVAFWMLWNEHRDLLTKLAGSPSPLRSGAQPVEFWQAESRKVLEEFRKVVREEIAATRTTLTVTGPIVKPPVESE